MRERVLGRRFAAALLPRLFAGHTTRAPPVGFELETNGFQFYIFDNEKQCGFGPSLPVSNISRYDSSALHRKAGRRDSETTRPGGICPLTCLKRCIKKKTEPDSRKEISEENLGASLCEFIRPDVETLCLNNKKLANLLFRTLVRLTQICYQRDNDKRLRLKSLAKLQ